MKREYVIVNNEHGVPERFLFWGMKSKDCEERSFGGYTDNLDNCERYSKKDILQSGYDFKFYEEGMSIDDFIKHDDVVIKLKDLNVLCDIRTVALLKFYPKTYKKRR